MTIGSDEIESVRATSEKKLSHLGVGVRGYPDGIESQEVPDDLIACDAVVQVLIREAKGGRSGYLVTSREGRTGIEVSPTQIFSAWFALGREVMKRIDPADPHIGWMNAIADGTITAIDHVQRKGKLRRKTGLIGADGNELLRDSDDDA